MPPLWMRRLGAQGQCRHSGLTLDIVLRQGAHLRQLGKPGCRLLTRVWDGRPWCVCVCVRACEGRGTAAASAMQPTLGSLGRGAPSPLHPAQASRACSTRMLKWWVHPHQGWEMG